MTLDPTELINKATEFVKEAGRQAEAVAKKVVASSDVDGSGMSTLAKKMAESADHVAKKAPAKKVDPKQAEAEADKAEAAAERAREQGDLAARTARTEADIRAKRAASEAREQADELRERGEETAKGLETAAKGMRNAPGGDVAAAELEKSANAVRAAAKAEAAKIEKVGEDAYQRAIQDGEIAAKAAEKAAHEKAMEYEGAADDARDDAAAARASTRMHTETAPKKRAEPERDRPEISKEKQVDLDAADAEAVRAEATAARAAAREGYETEAVRLTKARDEAAREQFSQEQDAKAAQMQVKREQRVVDEARATAERLNREADAARDEGDHALADSLREKAQRAASDQRIAEARLESAHTEADRGLKSSQEAKAQVEQLEKQYKDLQANRDQAERAVDGLEERARLLEEAQKKLDQADQTGNEKLRQEADALVEQAEKVHVDRTVVAAGQAGGDEGPVTTPGADEGPVTKPVETTDDQPQTIAAPPAPGQPTAAELRALTEKYGNAAQALHKRRLEEARTGDPDDHRREVSREFVAVEAQLKKEVESRDASKAKHEQYQKEAESLEREATQLFRQGKSTEAEEKQEAADLAAARADRMATLQKDAESQVTTLQARKEELDKQWKEEIDQHLGDPEGAELEKTADQMDDAARAMGDAYRARLDADDLLARAATASDPGAKAQLEQQAREAVEKSNQLLEKARQGAPRDESSQKALEDAGVTDGPTATQPAGDEGPVTKPDATADDQRSPADDQPTTSNEPTAAELREMTEKYAEAAQAVHKQRVELKLPDEDYEKRMDAHLELKGLRSQLEETSKARSEWPAEAKRHQETAERLNREAELLDRQGKSKQAEEKREEADLESGSAQGLEQALEKVGDREATIKARMETVQKQVESHKAGAANRKQQQEQLEVTADKLDDVARTMGDAYRARLDADDLRVRAAHAGDQATKAQLETQAQEAVARSNQLLEQARQMVPTNDVARRALDDAGVVDGSAVPPAPATSPPAGATTEVVGDEEDPTTEGRDATGDAEQGATTEARSEVESPEAGSPEAGTGDVVGDDGPAEQGTSSAAQELGAGVVEVPPADDQAAVGTAGESQDEMDGAGRPDVEIYAEQEPTFDEQSVAAAPAPPVPEAEFEATPDDEYVG